MRLKELRRLVKITEVLDDDTSVTFNFCGYTADDEWLESIEINNDREFEYVNLVINGKAYEA